MAVNPPVDAELSGFEADAAAPTDVAEFWSTLWPWDDLNAKTPPAVRPQLGRDVLAVLASLTVARSPSGPRALVADAAGRLQTAGMGAFSDVVTALMNPADESMPVADNSLYSAGMMVVIPGYGTPGFQRDYVGIVLLGGEGGHSFGGGPDFVLVRPPVPTFIGAGTPVLVMAPTAAVLPPAPWTAPNLRPIFLSRGAAGTSTLLLGVNGQSIFIFGIELAVTVPAAAQVGLVKDTSGHNIAEIRADTIHELYVDLHGAPLGQSDGLLFQTTGGAAVDVYISASQQ